MKVEFILAYDDNTWQTKTIDVPNNVTEGIPSHDPRWDAALVAYALDVVGFVGVRGVVYVGVYNSNMVRRAAKRLPCKFCGGLIVSGGHSHRGGHVCEACWDERLRVTA